ncbi:MAG: hypothetical protein RIS48_826 [Pseudomonadota bacterium]|jgi:hypothetical protein|uniref:hypothetical protein n=1 Tax=Malikia spinosa TaxID=86180 RepID=UPI0032393A03
MSTSPNNPPSSLWQLMAPHLGLIALSFALSRLTFELHELLTPYVAYTQGVDLLFLPAGVKLVLIMVAGWRGALGCGLSLLSLSTRFWPGLEPVWLLCYSTLSVGITWLVVSVMLRHMALEPTLEGLSFWELVQIDMLNTLLHGIAVNGYFWSLGLRSSETFWSAALAMTLGDFLGAGVIMLVVLLAARLIAPART